MQVSSLSSARKDNIFSYPIPQLLPRYHSYSSNNFPRSAEITASTSPAQTARRPMAMTTPTPTPTVSVASPIPAAHATSLLHFFPMGVRRPLFLAWLRAANAWWLLRQAQQQPLATARQRGTRGRNQEHGALRGTGMENLLVKRLPLSSQNLVIIRW